jgi:hypothetical protein
LKICDRHYHFGQYIPSVREISFGQNEKWSVCSECFAEMKNLMETKPRGAQRTRKVIRKTKKESTRSL